MSRTETSNVPPPRSKTKIFSFFLDDRPYARAAAVGSGRTRSTFEAGDLAGVLGGLALGVVEVGRHGDDRLVDLLAEIGLGGLLQIAEDHRGDFFGRVGLAADLDLDHLFRPADDLYGTIFSSWATSLWRRPMKRLMREDGVLAVGDLLVLGGLPDQDFAFFGKRDDRRRQPAALRS